MLSSSWMAPALQWFTPSAAAATVFALVISWLFYRARMNYLRVPFLPRIPPGKTPRGLSVVVIRRVRKGA